MIEEAIDKIVALSHVPEDGREAILTATDGSGKQWLYNDAERRYEPLADAIVKQSGAVSNIESFIALVLEETKRRPIDGKPHNGEFMTVVFNLAGGKFSADDRLRRDHFTYERTLSPQWRALIATLNKPLEHKQLVSALQLLRPSIIGYADLMLQLRKIHFTDKTNIVSEPTLQDGKNENTYGVEVAVTGGTSNTTRTALPSQFDVNLQYARGSEKRYSTTIEIDLSTIQKGERKELRFTLIAPDLTNVEEAAVEDEVALFREQTKAVPRLLTLVDY